MEGQFKVPKTGPKTGSNQFGGGKMSRDTFNCFFKNQELLLFFSSRRRRIAKKAFQNDGRDCDEDQVSPRPPLSIPVVAEVLGGTPAVGQPVVGRVTAI